MLKWKMGGVQSPASKDSKLASLPSGFQTHLSPCLLPNKHPHLVLRWQVAASCRFRHQGALRRHSEEQEAGYLKPVKVTGTLLFAVTSLLRSPGNHKPKPASAQEGDWRLCLSSFSLLGGSECRCDRPGWWKRKLAPRSPVQTAFSWIPS